MTYYFSKEAFIMEMKLLNPKDKQLALERAFALAAQKYIQKGLRLGQSYMVLLGDIDNLLYVKITKDFPEADCFYQNDRIPAFLDMVQKEWKL